jgi:glucose/mannose-6-phosphate isomerase
MIKKYKMSQIIQEFPKQFKVGFEAAKDVKLKDKFKSLLICAMGGSSLGGEILKIWLKTSTINLSLFLNKTYSLPQFVDKNHLILAISYSGNTEETLSAFREALRKNLKIVAITSDGKLAKLCNKHRVPLVLLPGGYPPRMSLGFQFGALMRILINCQIIKGGKKDLLLLEDKLNPKKLEKEGRKLAKKLKNKIPLIYASKVNKGLALIWKIKFNENSKFPAFCNYFPELSHNEIVGFTNKQKNKNFHIIILKDSSDHPKILKRMKLTANILKTRRISSDFIEMNEKNILLKIFSNILLADWTSYYLALENGVDPIPVKIVEEFKRKMKNLKNE